MAGSHVYVGTVSTGVWAVLRAPERPPSDTVRHNIHRQVSCHQEHRDACHVGNMGRKWRFEILNSWEGYRKNKVWRDNGLWEGVEDSPINSAGAEQSHDTKEGKHRAVDTERTRLGGNWGP